METLTCEQCSKKWKRQPSRGRKPRLCPKCLAAPQEASQPISQPSQPVTAKKPATKLQQNVTADYKFPGPTKWMCKTCGTSIKTEISLQYEPTHRCQKKLRRIIALELIRS
jgi:rubrerythrin